MELTCDSSWSPSARCTSTLAPRNGSGMAASSPSTTCNLKESSGRLPPFFAAASAASSTAATTSGEQLLEMQQTFNVLQTFRSRDASTASLNLSLLALSDAYNHAPPLPCKLAGTPACLASEPRVATAEPEPLATPSAKRESLSKAHPEARDALSIKHTAPSGSPASCRAGSRANRMSALAVPRASLPMRKTTVLPPRKTPVASANTFGRPSKTKPTTPKAAPMRSTFHPLCSTVCVTVPRRLLAFIQPRKPSIIPVLSFSVATRRVVDLPLAFASSTSETLATKTSSQTTLSSSRCANAAKKAEICSSVTDPIFSKAAMALPTASRLTFFSAAGK
mmetsp:Transcript_48138/g.112573  ORF Transcript_48138/g.112573 Transcript_48138/m.112573 type:complete len:336 (+) Transcript_48138:484-1491(+)